MYFRDRGDKRYRVMDWRLGKERNESRMTPCFLVPTTKRPLMPVKENSGTGRRKPDFRFGHVESEMPADVSEELRDWLEHV